MSGQVFIKVTFCFYYFFVLMNRSMRGKALTIKRQLNKLKVTLYSHSLSQLTAILPKLPSV